jgi:hypothetical protein
LYNALPGVRRVYGVRYQPVFVQLVAKLDAYREAGVIVKTGTFLAAQQWRYGEALEPWHLLSPDAYGVFTAFQTERGVRTVVLDEQQRQDYYKTILPALSRARQESETLTFAALVAAGFA